MDNKRLNETSFKNTKDVKNYIKNDSFNKPKGGYASYIQFNKNRNYNSDIENNNSKNLTPKQGKSYSLISNNNTEERKKTKNKISRYESNNILNNFHNNIAYNTYSYENDISNSSTFNSSGMTKLIDNHYSRHLEINDTNNLQYSNKLLGIVNRKEIKQRTSLNLENEKFKEHYNRLNTQEIQKEKKNFPILKSSTNLPFLTERPIQQYKRYYHSRNLTNNEPIRILSTDENLNTLTKTDESIKNKSTISLIGRRNTLDYTHSKTERRNYLRLNTNFNTIPKNFSAETKEKKKFNKIFNKNVTFNVEKSSENDLSNSNSEIKYNGYIPNFKRIKSKNKTKKIFKKRMSTYLRELSKISEKSNTNIFHLKPEKTFKKSISINPKKTNSKTEEKDGKKHTRKSSFDISSKQVINSFCENDFFCKKESWKKTSESEDYESEKLVLQKDLHLEKRNKDVFQLKHVSEKKIHKHENKLYSFEEEIKENCQIINGNKFYYKNNLLSNYLENLKNKFNEEIKEIYKHMNIKLNSKTEYIKQLKKDKTLKKHSIHFQNKVYKEFKKQKISKNFFNLSFSNSHLLYNYLSVDLSRLIFKEHYLKNLNGNNFGNLFDNFSQKTLNLRRSSVLKNKGSSIILVFKKHSIPEINELPRENAIFIIHFYQIDYEYNIIPSIFAVKIEKVKLKIDNDSYNKQKKNKKLNIFKKISTNSLIQDTILNYKNEKFLLRNALSKNSFYTRKIKRGCRRSTLSNIQNIHNLKSTYTSLQRKIQERKITGGKFESKNQMIFEVNELKQKLIESLNTQYDKILFYVKDKNYARFKEIYEQYKIEPETKDKDGNSLLNLAVQSNSFQIVDYLLNVGASPNTQNNKNNTPLHYALTFHNYEIADILIRRGADEKAINKLGATPWECLDSALSII